MAGAEFAVACRIEPELVQEDSPFKGTKRFGMCFVSNQGLSKYGTVLEITKHVVQEDGRLLILTKGKERFRLQNISQEKPVLLCDVEMLQDSCDEESLQESATKAKELFTNLVKMNSRYRKIEASEEHLVCSHTMQHDSVHDCLFQLQNNSSQCSVVQNPPELAQLPPSQLPFWIASMFGNTPEGQQKVLEMNAPQERLEYIVATLDEALKHTTAALAIDSVFASPSAEDSSNPDRDASVKDKAEGESGKTKGSE